jgi:hypothetical protein
VRGSTSLEASFFTASAHLRKILAPRQRHAAASHILPFQREKILLQKLLSLKSVITNILC